MSQPPGRKKSRKRRAPPPRPAAAGSPARSPYSAPGDGGDLSFTDAPTPPLTRAQKTEAKNEAVRQTLEPLAKGERPPWVTYGALLALGLGLLNIVLYGVGVRVKDASFGSTVVIGWILVVTAIGMWRRWYPAVLAFEVLMGVTAVFAALSLLVASSISGALRSLIVLGVAGLFFWKLIRAMARLQMPARPGDAPR